VTVKIRPQSWQCVAVERRQLSVITDEPRTKYRILVKSVTNHRQIRSSGENASPHHDDFYHRKPICRRVCKRSPPHKFHHVAIVLTDFITNQQLMIGDMTSALLELIIFLLISLTDKKLLLSGKNVKKHSRC